MARRANFLVGAVPLFLLVALVAFRACSPRPLADLGGVELYADPDHLRLSPGGATLVMLQPQHPLALELVSEVQLSSVTVDLSPEAPSRLAALGGEVGLRLFRPDGTMLYQLLLDSGHRRRRFWLGSKKFHYPLVLTLEGAEPGEVQITLTVERLAPAPRPPANTESDHE